MAWSGHGEGRSCPYPTAALHKDYWARRGPPRSRGDGRVLNSTSRLEAVMMGVYYMMGVHDGRMLTDSGLESFFPAPWPRLAPWPLAPGCSLVHSPAVCRPEVGAFKDQNHVPLKSQANSAPYKYFVVSSQVPRGNP